VVTQRHVDGGEHRDQDGELEQAGDGVGQERPRHQNRPGKSMVRSR